MSPLERSDRAKELLENPVFKEAYGAVRTELITALETLGFNDHEAQHETVLMLQLLKRIKTKLERFVDEGKVEQKKLADMNYREKLRQVWKG